VVYGSRKLRVAVDDVAAGGRFFVDLQDAEPSAVELDLAKELIERSTALQRDVRAPARGSRERIASRMAIRTLKARTSARCESGALVR
jgi:hypothetical protein